MDENFLKNVLLEKEQEKLLCTIVEAARNVPSEKRHEFLVARSKDGDFLIHPGLPGGEIKFYAPDLQTLMGEELIQVTGSNQYGISRFDIHPRGFRYYKYLKERSGESVEHIEETIRSYINSYDFQREYPKAYEKWEEAESLLWETDTSKQLTKIGHLCREAIQEFMDTLYSQVELSGEHIPKKATKARLREVITAKSEKFGKTEKRLLGVIYEYWDIVNDLIQKQEHNAQKERVQLVWKDARRVVFQTIVLMFELSQSLK